MRSSALGQAAKLHFKSLTMFSKIRVVLVDLSGTIHIDDTEIPGAIDAVNRLKQDANLNVKFVTNTTKESKRILTERLHKIGFNIASDEIFTSLTAARQLIDRDKLSPMLMIDDRAMEEFEGIGRDTKDAVLIGLAPDKFNYDSMNEAFRLLLNGARLIAIHKARYFKKKDGLALGPGPFVSALEFAADSQAEVVGKPEKSFFLSAVSEFDVTPDDCVMIGDDARDDVCGAIQAGMKGILVKTGKFRPGDEKHLPAEGKIAEGFSDAVEMILKDVQGTKSS